MNESDDLLRMIRDSANAVGAKGDAARVRALRFKGPGFDLARWREMAEMGWVGLLVPESSGGSELGIAALAALAEELGARIVPEPLVDSAIAASLLRGGALAEALTGETLILPAWQDQPNVLLPDSSLILAGGKATGTRRFIAGGEAAGAFLLMTPSSAAIARAGAPGLSIETDPTQDGGRFATLRLDGVDVEPLEVSAEQIAEALDHATLATSAYLVGLMEQAFEMTLDYLRTRVQFDKVIGTFQALQHRAADLSVQIALSRASVNDAVRIVSASPTADERSTAISRAKARTADAAMLVTRQAIQLHGGIGFTDEHDIGLFLRRAMVLANAYGSSALHRRRYAQLTHARLENAA